MRRLAPAFVVAFVFAGCGGNPPPASVSVPARGAKHPAASATVATLPANALRRSVVEDALAAGPGAFLQRLTVDEHPVFLGGKFHGFRIAALRGDTWGGIDLRPGDVVTRVNGFPIEHPDDAAEAFYSLRVASELRVEYERDGEPRELRFSIVDDRPPSDAGARRD